MAIKMKRGTTQEWTFGPELIHFEKLKVNGKDSTIHCEDIHIRMYAYTNSAEVFPTDTQNKQLGLWLIQNGELPLDTNKQYRLCMKVNGPPDCELYVTDGFYEYDGYCRGGESTEDVLEGYQDDLRWWIQWPEEKIQPEEINIYISVREINAYEELEEGQLGLEYTENGQIKLKAGMPNKSKWNELPYINAHDHFYVVSPSGTVNVFNHWTVQTIIGAMDFETWCDSDLNLFGFTYNETGVCDPNGDPLFLTRDEAINQENPILPSDTIQLYYTYYTG